MGWQDRPYYRDDNGGVPPVVFAFPKLSRLTMGIIVSCLALFITQAVTRGSGRFDPFTRWGALWFVDGLAFIQPWRWITYQYLHASAGHFFFNMLAVYFFLPALEGMWGWKKALVFYTMGGIAAGVTFFLLGAISPLVGQLPLVGASGSTFAALGAVALLSPSRQLILLVFPVPIRVAAALFGGFFLLSALADRDPSSAAHLGGLAFGFLAPWLAGPILRKRLGDYQGWQRQRVAKQEVDLEQEVDRILQKVRDQGMNSLSRSERGTLRAATERQRATDQARARRVR